MQTCGNIAKCGDIIKIENLEIYAHHGAFEEETRLGQAFFVNARLYTSTRQAGLTDELRCSTHYGEVCLFIRDYLTGHTFRLLEAAAEQLARQLLLAFPRVRALTLEIRKPSAPIPLPFQSVSVEITRGWSRAYVAFGSNLGDRRAHIEKAVQSIRENSCCRLQRVSEFYASTPYGGVEQEDFVNGALSLDTLLSPEELLDFLQSLEKEAGRERKVHWGPRTLDLDILLYEDMALNTERLTLPHPDMQNRDFVLKPLAEIAPALCHPLFHKNVSQLLEELARSGEKHLT